MVDKPANLPSLAPRTFQEAREFSDMLAKSDFVPKHFQGKPGDILAAIQMGYEVGLAPMAALQNIAVINGRPSIWGDGLLAIVQASGLLIHHKEYYRDDGAAVCEVGRKGDRDNETSKQLIHVVTFSDDDGKRAQLLSKSGPWTQYPKRMKMWRARGYALRDKFADVLKGLIAREEAIYITPSEQDGRVELKPDGHFATAFDDVEIVADRAEGKPEEGKGQPGAGSSGGVAAGAARARIPEGNVQPPPIRRGDSDDQSSISADYNMQRVEAGEDLLTDAEKAAAVEAFSNHPRKSAPVKLAAIRELIPGFKDPGSLKTREELERFNTALAGL